MATNSERREWARRRKIVQVVDKLIEKEDNAEPSALDEKDREAVRVVVRISAESDAVFRQVLRKRGPIAWSDRVDHLCDSIEAGMEFFATVKQSARIIGGVRLPPRKSGSLRSLVAEHRELFDDLQKRDIGLPKRLSVLLELIRIELIFFSHVW
jgi:hypothetical protein